MFDTFQLKSCGAGLMGYHWEAAEPAVVLCIIHGMGEHGGKYDLLAEEMIKNNISVLAMDLRGHGCSIGKRGHIGDRHTVLRDVDSLIAQASKKYEHLPIALYGHSLGGNIILDYRLRGSLAAVPTLYIAASPWLVLTRKYSPVKRGLLKMVGMMKPRHLLRAHVNKRISDKLTHDFISARTLLEGTKAAKHLLNPDYHDRAKQKKPIIIMHGADDKICTVEGPERISEIVGEMCSLIEWDGYGHELHSIDGGSDGMAYFHKLADIIVAI